MFLSGLNNLERIFKMVEGKNFSNQIVPRTVDIEYRDCNFSHSNCLTVLGQKVGVRIFPDDDTPRTFIDCNMTNCEPPPESSMINSYSTITERMVISNTDIVQIDTEQIEVHYYVDRIYGHYHEGIYTYHSIPIDIVRRLR